MLCVPSLFVFRRTALPLWDRMAVANKQHVYGACSTARFFFEQDSSAFRLSNNRSPDNIHRIWLRSRRSLQCVTSADSHCHSGRTDRVCSSLFIFYSNSQDCIKLSKLYLNFKRTHNALNTSVYDFVFSKGNARMAMNTFRTRETNPYIVFFFVHIVWQRWMLWWLKAGCGFDIASRFLRTVPSDCESSFAIY